MNLPVEQASFQDYSLGYRPTQDERGNGRSEKPCSFHLTDLGNAERFALHYRETVRWCETWKSWLIYNGTYWETDKTGQVDRAAKATVRAIYHEAAAELDDARRAKLAKHALGSESNRAVRAMLDRVKSELPALPSEFNQHLHLLNCANGTLDVKTGKLRPHAASDMLTRWLPINYDESAKSELWESFITSIFAGDSDLIAFMQQALGMSLSGDTSEQCLFICHGGGSNGKTTLFETVRILLSTYALAANIETFQVRKGERITNDVAELYGARFVTAEENTLGSRLNEAFIKKATGKQPLRARRLHENEFEFMPEFTIWLAVNHKPVVKDTSKGMWRRVHFIPFTVTIEGDQVDKHLLEKLLTEAPGILAWLVQGCRKWYQQGRLSIPNVVRDATSAYRHEMDVIARFIDERCEPGGSVGATELYQAYKAWCEEFGEPYEKQTSFGTQLAERGYRKEKAGTIKYHGLSLARRSGQLDSLDSYSELNANTLETREKMQKNCPNPPTVQHRDENTSPISVLDSFPSEYHVALSRLEEILPAHAKYGEVHWMERLSGFPSELVTPEEYMRRIRVCLASGDFRRIQSAVAEIERHLQA